MKRFEIVLPSEIISIPGIELLEPIGRGAESLVFKARRGRQIVALKIHRDDIPGPERKEAYRRLRREAAILGCLRHPSLASLIALGETEGRPYIVMEYVAGVTLRSRLDHGRLEEREILSLARQVAGALAEIHRHGHVHRDVTPKNVMIDDHGNAKLVDLSFVTRIERNSQRTSGRVVGTFSYAAPEQSGILHRPLDGRSDLYALGVILFECAAGKPPFEADDAGELLYQHAVITPPAVSVMVPKISVTLSRMIAKLLAKDPDDRYQSAESLIADLDRFEELERSEARGTPIPLGESAQSPAGAFEVAFVGRHGELTLLTDAWLRARSGIGGVVVIEGEEGSGKSRLVREMIKRAGADQRRPLVIEGRCSKETRAPFGAFRDALDDVLPDLSGAPPLASARDGFCELAASLIARRAHEHGGMILAIDGLDWISEEPWEVVLRLARRVREVPLLIVLTARGESEACRRMLDELRPLGAGSINLEPFDPAALRLLITSILGGDVPDEQTVRHIADRSNGNPQLAIDHLSAMLDAGVLWPSFGAWTLDEAELQHLHLPKDLLELLLARIASLSDGARKVLSAAAVWGDSFDRQTLLRICGADIEIVHATISEATRARLIERRDKAYVFVHQRIQEAFLGTLSEEESKALHRKSAEILELKQDQSDEHLYALAKHWTLSDRALYPNMVYEANFAAGKRALAKFANAQAQKFLNVALDTATSASIEPDPALAEALGEAYTRVGDLGAARIQNERALAIFEDPMRRASLRVQLAELSLANGDVASAEIEAERAFAEIGLPFEQRGPAMHLRMAWDLMLADHRLRGVDESEAAVLASLWELSAQLGEVSLRRFGRLGAAARQLRAAMVLGPGKELVRAHVSYAGALADNGLRAGAIEHARTAVTLAEKQGDRESFARSLANYARIKNATGDAREAEALAARALDDHGVWLEVQEHVFATTDLVWNLLLRGHPREAWTWLERAGVRGDAAAPLREQPHSRLYHAFAGSVLALLGRHSESHAHLELYARQLESVPGDRVGRLHHLAHLVFAYVEQGEIGARLEEALAAHESLGVKPKSAPFHTRHFYLVKAHARLLQLGALVQSESSPRTIAAKLRQVDGALRDLEAVSNVSVFESHLDLFRGLRAQLGGDARDVAAHFSRAEEKARAADCPWVLEQVAAARARTLLQQGNSAAALREARTAYNIASEQGYGHRARELRSQFLLASQVLRTAGSSTDLSSVLMQRQRDALLQVSFASAAVTDPDEQTRIALDQIVKILHAERAFLFLTDRGDKLEFRAARSAVGQDIRDDGSYMRSVIETVRASREPLVVNSTDEEDAAPAGMNGRPLRNVMAAPLMKGDRLVGVIYLDTRVARGIFSEDNLKILVAIANHVYVTLEATRTAQLEVYHRIAANVPGALYRVILRADGGLDVPFISSGCKELLGVESEAIQQDAQRLIEAIHSEEHRSFLESLKQSAGSLAPWSWEGRSAQHDARLRWIKIAGRPQRLTSGDTLVDGLVIDITERKRAEEALERAVEELARTSWRERQRAEALKEAHERLIEANRRIKEEQSKLIHAEKLSSIGRLAAGVAHEINNPLTGVMACVEALESFNVAEDRREQYFETIKDGLDRMKTVVQSLLDFATPHATEFKSVDVHPLVISTLRLLQPEIVRRKVRLNIRIRRGKTWVEGNRSQLMQALMNVLTNALHASSQDGEIRISSRIDGERVGIEIADDGPGIPEELIGRVCEPFFTTKPQGEGTGLGMAVTLGIIEGHHGELQIESKVGRGTRVTIWLKGQEARDEDTADGPARP